MKMVLYIVATALVLLFVTAPSKAQDAVQNSAQVLTPSGYRDRANVHQIPSGYRLIRMSAGHMRAENPVTGAVIDYAEAAGKCGSAPAKSAADAGPGYPPNFWLTYAVWQNQTGTPISYFTTTWKVPPSPVHKTAGSFMLFSTMLSNEEWSTPPTFDVGLQFVLLYGIDYNIPGTAPGTWTLMVWYEEEYAAWYTPPIRVNPGKKLTGEFTLIGQTKKGTFDYLCDLKGVDGNQYTISIFHVPELVWCVDGLKAYTTPPCDGFPSTAFTAMSGIKVQTGSVTPSVTWTPNTLQFVCGLQTTIVQDGGKDGLIHIYY
jgi:hypothetical protein